MVRYSQENESNLVHDDCFAWYPDPEDVRVNHWYAPGRIMAFVTTETTSNGCYDIDDVYAILATCEYKHVPSSLFSTKWTSAYAYDSNKRKHQRMEMIAVNSFVRHSLMIMEQHGVYHEVWPKALWGKQFHE